MKNFIFFVFLWLSFSSCSTFKALPQGEEEIIKELNKRLENLFIVLNSNKEEGSQEICEFLIVKRAEYIRKDNLYQVVIFSNNCDKLLNIHVRLTSQSSWEASVSGPVFSPISGEDFDNQLKKNWTFKFNLKVNTKKAVVFVNEVAKDNGFQSTVILNNN